MGLKTEDKRREGWGESKPGKRMSTLSNHKGRGWRGWKGK